MNEKRIGNLDSFKEAMEIDLFGRTKADAHKNKICLQCGGPATEFQNALSAREYQISGLCQKCQDELFGKWEQK